MARKAEKSKKKKLTTQAIKINFLSLTEIVEFFSASKLSTNYEMYLKLLRNLPKSLDCFPCFLSLIIYMYRYISLSYVSVWSGPCRFEGMVQVSRSICYFVPIFWKKLLSAASA